MNTARREPVKSLRSHRLAVKKAKEQFADKYFVAFTRGELYVRLNGQAMVKAE